ncbi:ABC transporter ATP-binding protein [Parabacteroides sp. An277]|uniref:ABC transporter permease n=1 Tax=Parabacteroides sp. An277 TaxID=1965619 RepID=UPI000B399B78|nr:ABC transporter permease [Parabacteroides sp. An277]OUO55005.1 ABC transporter ATP-binding protein [Parabacteroides sp. An277]
MLLFDRDRWIEIWVTITRNKVRSLLTCFGVFWGILMLIILLGSGTGLKNAVLGETEGFATNSFFFFTDRTSLPYKGFNKGRSWDLRNRDVASIQREVEGIDQITPLIFGASGDKNVVYGRKSGTYHVKGVAPAYFEIETQDLLFGRLLNQIDERERRKVCTIGEDVNKALFQNGNPCGKYIRVNGLYYQVVGVTRAKSSNISINGRADESVFIPFSTLQQSMHRGDKIDILAASVYPGYDVNAIIAQSKQIVFQQNQIAPDDPQALMVLNFAEMFGTFLNLFLGIDILVWIVGMGTLLAGIIGVSNIMMVTVKERTKEIGVRRALGAKPFDIISQVMSESLMLTAMAGLLGLSCGVFLLDLANRLLLAIPSDNIIMKDPSVNIQIAVAATLVLLFSGLLAGLIPAWRAMQIKAIDALRDE